MWARSPGRALIFDRPDGFSEGSDSRRLTASIWSPVLGALVAGN